MLLFRCQGQKGVTIHELIEMSKAKIVVEKQQRRPWVKDEKRKITLIGTTDAISYAKVR